MEFKILSQEISCHIFCISAIAIFQHRRYYVKNATSSMLVGDPMAVGLSSSTATMSSMSDGDLISAGLSSSTATTSSMSDGYPMTVGPSSITAYRHHIIHVGRRSNGSWTLFICCRNVINVFSLIA
jgi:hypothetical protein